MLIIISSILHKQLCDDWSKPFAQAQFFVEIYLFGPVIPVTVGTGGATRGTKAVAVADGFTDAATHDSDGTGNESNYGVFMQTGTAGQIIGMMLMVGNRGL